MYDINGDIVHRLANKLRAMLHKLGYALEQGVYRHPNRQMIFVGDFIDRGPYIRETLEIVRDMVDGGTALAVMGNHEYNGICFHEKHPQGGHLRPHTPRNILQHIRTLQEFTSQEGWKQW